MKSFPLCGLILLAVFVTLCPLTAQTTLDAYFQAAPKGEPLICAHRGGGDTNLPENSLSLFTALAESFGQRPVMIELDVRKSADGELFILHDATLDRTTTGTDSIHLVGTDYLRELHLTTGDGSVTEDKIPAFREVLTWLQGQDNVFLMVDVKGNCWREVTEMIREYQLTGRCLLLTFSPANTLLAYDLLPEGWISTLVNDASAYQQIQALNLPTGHLVGYINASTPKSLIKELRRKGLILTTDVSEQSRSYPQPLTRHFYRAFARKHKLGILVSDYPLRVKGFLRRN